MRDPTFLSCINPTVGLYIMPAVLRLGGFRVLVLFPPREHPPPHVHVVNADGIAVIQLVQERKCQTTMRVDGMKPRDVRKAEQIVTEHTALLLKRWREIHG
ncbi:MAG TPA: DUF4160 domain-containing protein [Gemmatimonadaceae bacterium]|nr:DUF4160 domain-containing protein [Gemmatimonadaceae bacterium]